MYGCLVAACARYGGEHFHMTREEKDAIELGLKLVHQTERPSYTDSYGTKEYYQLVDHSVYRVYQLDDGPRHFRQNGSQSSYSSDPDWESEMVEIYPEMNGLDDN